jgi:sigma-B regulation protein RsbU (phosphoserine phosphatase)
MPPIVCQADGEIVDLPQGGIPIGILPDFPWQEHATSLASGDLLFTYTDGLSEAGRKKTGELFGEDRIRAFLKANREMAPDDLNRAIVREAQSFSGSAHLADDITLLSLKAA